MTAMITGSFIERRFSVAVKGTRKSLCIRFSKPRLNSKGWYVCKYAITIADKKILHNGVVRGADGVQALLLAMGQVIVAFETALHHIKVPRGYLSDLRQLRPNLEQAVE